MTANTIIDDDLDHDSRQPQQQMEFFQALRDVDVGRILWLVNDMHVDINIRHPILGMTPLSYVSDFGYTELVRLFLRKGARVNELDTIWGQTALHVACEHGYQDIAQLLIAHGADIHATTSTGYTPLHAAALNGHESLAVFLLQYGADLRSGSAMSVYSVAHTNELALRLTQNYIIQQYRGYLQHGVSHILHHARTITVSSAVAPIHPAIDMVNMCAICALLVILLCFHLWKKSHPLPYSDIFTLVARKRTSMILEQMDHASLNAVLAVNVAVHLGRNEPLYQAACQGDLTTIRRLIEEDHGILGSAGGTNVNYKTSGTFRETALHCAVREGHTDVVAVLLDKGANIQVTDDPSGCTPLERAIRHGLYDLALFLVQRGADVRSRNKRTGATMLHEAVKSGSIRLVRFLLDHAGAAKDVNTPDGDGWTPLYVVEDVSILLSLLEHGADVNYENTLGWTPLHSAVTAGRSEVVYYLLEHGADVSAPSIQGWTALHEASEYGHRDIVQMLLRKQPSTAMVHTVDVEGTTPLHAATSRGHREVAQTLMEYGADVWMLNDYGQTSLDVSRNHGTRQWILEYHFEDTEQLNDLPDRWRLSSGVDDESKSIHRMENIYMAPKREQMTMLTKGGFGAIAVLGWWILIRTVRKK